jgi:SET domain-containing protein
MCATMFELYGGKYFDGYKDSKGKNLSIENNPGAWINHSKQGNAKMYNLSVSGQIRLILVSVKAIPKGHEVSYNYGDRRKGLESWIY